MRHKAEIIEHIRQLKAKTGYNYSQLSRYSGIPANTIGTWFRFPNTFDHKSEILNKYQERRDKIKIIDVDCLDKIDTKSPDACRLLASILYWCEGSKYPATNAVVFVNSDRKLVNVFITLLRRCYQIDESKFRVHLQIHESDNYHELLFIWSNELNIPASQFMKPTKTRKRFGKHRSVYEGTCTLKYFDYKIQLRLIGLYESASARLI